MVKEKSKRAAYTIEFKREAVRLVEGGQGKPVSVEQMELARLRAELAQVKIERDILKKATVYFAREST